MPPGTRLWQSPITTLSEEGRSTFALTRMHQVSHQVPCIRKEPPWFPASSAVWPSLSPCPLWASFPHLGALEMVCDFW